MAYALSLESLPTLFAALLEGALGLFLTFRARGRAANLALGLFFTIRGIRELLDFLRMSSVDHATWYGWRVADFGTALADGVFLVYFLVTYPAPRQWLPRVMVRAWPYVGLAVVVGLVVSVRPALWMDVSAHRDCAAFEHALCPRGVPELPGTLVVLDNLTELATGLAPLVLMLVALAPREARPEWRAAIVLAGAISFGRLFGMAGSTASWIMSGAAPPSGLLGWTDTYVELGVVLALVAAGLALGFTGRLDPARARAARWFAAGMVGVLALGAFTELVLVGREWGATLVLLRSVTLFLVPLVVGVTMLRHDVLGLDLRVRWTIRRGTVAAVFLGVFIVATQVAQNVFSESYGILWGGMVTGVMLVGLAPMQRFAERLANAAAPEVADGAPRSEKERAYRNALRLALRDRVVTRREELELAHLAEQLGLGAHRALEIRHEVDAEANASRPDPVG